MTIEQPVTVSDDKFGLSAYGIFLSIGTTTGRVLQNFIQTSPTYRAWRNELSDKNGAIDNQHGSSTQEPIPDDALDLLKAPNGALLSVIPDAGKTYLECGLHFTKGLANIQGPYFPLERPVDSYFMDSFHSVSVSVIGLGSGSNAYFSSGSFDIEVFTDATDLTLAGRSLDSGNPDIGFVGNPNENSNLQYSAYASTFNSYRCKASSLF